MRRHAYRNEMENLKHLLHRHLLINNVTAADGSATNKFMRPVYSVKKIYIFLYKNMANSHVLFTTL